MKIKRTLKKGICYVATFAMVFAMSLGMGTIDAKAGGAKTISINGYALTVSESSPTAYYLNGGSAGSESNYNAKLEYDADESILTLNGLDITLDTSINKNGIDVSDISANDFKIVLEGDNKITDVVSNSSYFFFYTPYSDVTIGGDGTLTIVDNEFVISKGVNVDSLYITDSATMVIDIAQAKNYSCVINAGNGFKMDGSSFLKITVDDSSNDCYGIYVSGANKECTVTDSASIDIDILDANSLNSNQTARGIYTNSSVELSTTGSVSIDLAQYNMYGIEAASVDISNVDLDINLYDTSNQSKGIYSTGDMTVEDADVSITSSLVTSSSTGYGITGYEYGVDVKSITMAGDSTLDVTLGDANEVYGVRATNASAIKDNSSINVKTGDAQYQFYGVYVNANMNMDNNAIIEVDGGTGSPAYGVYANALFMSDNSVVETEISGHGVKACGVYASNLEMYGDSTMSNSVDGDSADIAFGAETSNCTMVDNTSYTAEVSGAKQLCSGMTTSNFTMAGNATYCVTAGDIIDVTKTGSLSTGLLVSASGTATVLGNSDMDVTSGTGEVGYGICLQAGTMTVGGDATIEVTSDMNAFDKMPTLDTVLDFMVKAGATDATATRQSEAAKQSLTTYNDNSYVLIRPMDVISTVAVKDIDTPVAFGEFDATGSSATTGIKSVSVVWTLNGETKQNVEADTEYILTVTAYPEDAYGFSPTTVVTLDNNPSISAQTTTINEDESITVTYKVTSKDNMLITIDNPSDITGVKNGTALANITLPGKVNIETATGDMEASVVWDKDNIYQGSYNPDSKEAQTFTLKGVVALPEGVDANGIVLAAYLKVNVSAGEQSTTSTSTEDDSATDTTVTTENKTDNTDGSVNTGDNSPIGIMLLLLGITYVGMAVVGKKNKEL